VHIVVVCDIRRPLSSSLIRTSVVNNRRPARSVVATATGGRLVAGRRELIVGSTVTAASSCRAARINA